MIKNRKIALIFRLVSFIFICIGLAYHINFNLSVTDRAFYAPFMYYTIQSNLLALILFVILTIRTIKGLKKDGGHGDAGYFARFEMVCVIDLLLTLIVYWVMLVPNMFSMAGEFNLFTFDNVAVHLVTPLLCLVDYIFFTRSHHLKYRDVYAVVIYPYAYIVFSWIAGFAGYAYRYTEEMTPVRFPYFFLDFDQVGAKVFLYIAVLTFFFLIISHLLYLLDKKWNKPVLIS